MAAARKPQPLVYEPKKRPRQARAQATFDALVDAAARVLVRRGYAGTTTNHIAEAAGVGVASLYEYFPGKDAVIAQVAERIVARVMTRLAASMGRILDAAPDDGVRLWIDAVYETLLAEKALVAVFVYQVPYTNRLPAIRAIMPALVQFSEAARQRAGARVRLPPSRASLYLLINLVAATILQLVLEPPDDVTAGELLAALSARVQQWLEGK